MISKKKITSLATSSHCSSPLHRRLQPELAWGVLTCRVTMVSTTAAAAATNAAYTPHKATIYVCNRLP